MKVVGLLCNHYVQRLLRTAYSDTAGVVSCSKRFFMSSTLFTFFTIFHFFLERFSSMK